MKRFLMNDLLKWKNKVHRVVDWLWAHSEKYACSKTGDALDRICGDECIQDLYAWCGTACSRLRLKLRKICRQRACGRIVINISLKLRYEVLCPIIENRTGWLIYRYTHWIPIWWEWVIGTTHNFIQEKSSVSMRMHVKKLQGAMLRSQGYDLYFHEFMEIAGESGKEKNMSAWGEIVFL